MSTEHNQPLDLDAIEARCAAVTEGRWILKPTYDPRFVLVEAVVIEGNPLHNLNLVGLGGVFRRGDGEFFFAARSDIPALVARVRELEAELARTKSERDEWYARLLTFEPGINHLVDYASELERVARIASSTPTATPDDHDASSTEI